MRKTQPVIIIKGSDDAISDINARCSELTVNFDRAPEQCESKAPPHEAQRRIIDIRVNDAPLAFINTKTAVAHDYLQFLEGMISALLNDREYLEKEANKSGRTINGHSLSCIGSVNIPEVTNE